MSEWSSLFEEALTFFEPVLRYQRVAKGTIVHRAHTFGNELYLITSGAMRSFYHLEGRDITAHIALEQGIIGAIDSIVLRKKSRYSIETLEQTSVYILNHDTMESFLEKHPSGERMARKISQQIYVDLVQRLEGMTFLSAKERYQHLIETQPSIIQRVNLGHIASYLGMTQETLSRIRGI